MPSLVLRLCGNVALCSADRVPIAPPLGAKTVGLLAFLALEPGPHRREELTAVMTRFLPGAPLSWMIGLGADAVAAELTAASIEAAA